MKQSARSGQVMILTVITLGGALLGATTIAGLLMLYQIRQGTDINNSAKAVYAADAGVEWGLYNVLCQVPGSGKSPCPIVGLPEMHNGTSVTVKCLDANGQGDETTCNPDNTVTIKTLGKSSNVSRAFCILSGCGIPSQTP